MRAHSIQQRRTSRSDQGGSREIAQYAADLILDLRNLAKAQEFKTLQGLLELSYYEAFALANPVILPAEEKEHLEILVKEANLHITAAGL